MYRIVYMVDDPTGKTARVYDAFSPALTWAQTIGGRVVEVVEPVDAEDDR